MLVNPFKILKHVIKSAFKRLNLSDSKPTMDKRFLYVKHCCGYQSVFFA